MNRNSLEFSNSMLKRFLAMLLAVLLLLPCFMVFGSENILLKGDVAAESSTVVYNAIKEFNSGSTQSGVWRYQATDDADNPVWRESTFRSGGSYWYDSTYQTNALRLINNGNMRIWNKGECLAQANRPSICWCFVAPDNGEINIPSAKITFREGKIAGNARVTLNGVQVYPETGWLSISSGNPATCEEITLNVSKGDKLRFEVAPSQKLDTSALGLRWIPELYFIDASKNYVDEDGIMNGLSAFMYNYFSGVEDSKLALESQRNKESVLASVDSSRYGTYAVTDAFCNGGILESSDNSVWKFAVKNKSEDNGLITYLCDSTVQNSGKSYESIILSNKDIASKYEVFVSYENLESGTTTPKNRSVTYHANENESMMFGFTAPFSGEYELSAPFSCEQPGAVENYAVLKESVNGDFVELEYETTITENNIFCNLQIELVKGDTVWLTASANRETTINIGIPTLRYFEDVSLDGTDYRRYRAVDYFESSYANEQDYDICSLTDNKTGGWNFGYFINPIDNTGTAVNYDTIGYGKYKVGDDATKLLDAFVPYELIRSGIYYNALPAVVKSDNSLLTEAGLNALGVMYPCLETEWDNRSKTGVPYLCRGIYSSFGVNNTKSGNLCNMGVYLQFTAPKSGDALLNLGDESNLTVGDRMIVLKNGKVVALYTGSVEKGKTIDLGFLNEDDTITICYGMTTKSFKSVYVGMPVITISGNTVTVDFKEENRTRQMRVNGGNTFALPYGNNVSGKRFAGWKGATTEVFEADTEIVINGNNFFEAIYQYFGDINNDGIINAYDMTLMRNALLDIKISGEIRNADVNIDGNFDAIDIVRIKKWLAGIVDVLGEQAG